MREQILRLVAVDAILLDDVQRMADLLHMDAGERAPGAAHGIEIAPAQILEPGHAFQMLIDQGAGDIAIGDRRIADPKRTERQRDMGAEPPVVEADQLDAAAAQIAHQAVGIGNARDDAERREPRLLRARENAHRHAPALAHRLRRTRRH